MTADVAEGVRGVAGQRWFFGASMLKSGQGGIARVSRMTARALLEAGGDVDLLAFADTTPTTIGGRCSRAASGSRLRFALGSHRAALERRRFLYDAVGLARAHPVLPSLRRPYGVWIHGVEVWHNLSADRARALRNADFVLANSRFTLERFEDMHFPLPRAAVVWLATEASERPVAPATFDGPPIVLVLGRADEGQLYKGHRELIDVWPRIVRAVPDARLLMVGGGSALSTVRAWAAASPAAAAIRVAGHVTEEELEAVWRSSHALAMPSRGEGFGLVYVEAMRHGLPVIASVHDAGQEVNVDGETGFNVDLDDPGALEERLLALLSDTDEARAMGVRGAARWESHFTYEGFRARLLASLFRP